jgi:glutathione S-transferase
MQYGPSSLLYPNEPKVRAGIDRWLDWSIGTLAPAERPLFLALVRTPADQRDAAKIETDLANTATLWTLLDQHLQGRFFLENERFSLADIVLGSFARRWYGLEGVERPTLPNLDRWYQRLAQRQGFRKYIDLPLT